jgi:hypothetical protein
VLPALELLCLEEGRAGGISGGVPRCSPELGRPVTVINEEREIRERFKTPDVGE